MVDSLRASTQPDSTCLTDEDIVAFALGRLSTARLAAAHQHLDSCETCQRLLSEAAHVLGAAATAPHTDSGDVSWNTTFQPGVMVGKRYRIRHFIARGGMGEVYEAFDDELQERVALKTVTSTAGDDSNAVRRLKAEVQLARRVSHPNVCRIYDFGTHVMAQTRAQISFLTMEFVDGETLGQRVRLGGAMPFDEARRLARQLLLGLSAAHEAGVLHRDFKSDNVMLRPAADEGVTALILDFGLARALDHGSQGAANSSNSNLVGTYDYIAPEQLDGKPHTTASDVYSFGIVWFEMLTGELPFEADSSPAIGALQRLHKTAPAPSSKNPRVPSGLDSIVLRCLRRAPKDRFQTVGEVLAALDAFNEQTRPIWQKRSWLGLSVAGCALGFLGYWGTRTPPQKPRSEPLVRSLASASPTRPAVAPVPSNVGEQAFEDPAPSAVALMRAARAPAPAPKTPPSRGALTHSAAPAVMGGSSAIEPVAENPAPPSSAQPTENGNLDDGAGRQGAGSAQPPAPGWEYPFGKHAGVTAVTGTSVSGKQADSSAKMP